jgi:hypothetical protein
MNRLVSQLEWYQMKNSSELVMNLNDTHRSYENELGSDKLILVA